MQKLYEFEALPENLYRSLKYTPDRIEGERFKRISYHKKHKNQLLTSQNFGE